MRCQFPRAPNLDETTFTEDQEEGGDTDTATQQTTAREHAGQGTVTSSTGTRALCEANDKFSSLDAYAISVCLAGQDFPKRVQVPTAGTAFGATFRNLSSASRVRPPTADMSSVATMLEDMPKISLHIHDTELTTVGENQTCSTTNDGVVSVFVWWSISNNNKTDSNQNRLPQHTHHNQPFSRSIRALIKAGGTTTPSTHEWSVFPATLAIAIKAIAAETGGDFVARFALHAQSRVNNMTFVFTIWLVHLQGDSRHTLRNEFSNHNDSFCKYCLFRHYMFHQILNSSLFRTHVNKRSFEPGLAFRESIEAQRVREEVLCKSRSYPHPFQGQGDTSTIEGKSNRERLFSYSCIVLWFTAATSVAAVWLMKRELASDIAKSYRQNPALREVIRSVLFPSFVIVLINVFDLIIVLTLFIFGATPNMLHGDTANSREFASNFQLGFFKLRMLSGGCYYPALSQTQSSLHLGTNLGCTVSHKSEGCSGQRAHSHHFQTVCLPPPGTRHTANDVHCQTNHTEERQGGKHFPAAITCSERHCTVELIFMRFHNRFTIIVDLVSPMPHLRGVSMIISNITCFVLHMYRCILVGRIVWQLHIV